MTTKKNVQVAHISPRTRALHMAMIRLASVMNRPEVDERLLSHAGVGLDRTLFPPLVTIERFGPIGIVDLAGRLGRDYTTVSRQVTRLEGLGLAKRQPDASDARVRAAVITAKGRKMTDALDAARERAACRLFVDWKAADVDTLVRLLQRFVDDIEKQATDQGEP